MEASLQGMGTESRIGSAFSSANMKERKKKWRRLRGESREDIASSSMVGNSNSKFVMLAHVWTSRTNYGSYFIGLCGML